MFTVTCALYHVSLLARRAHVCCTSFGCERRCTTVHGLADALAALGRLQNATEELAKLERCFDYVKTQLFDRMHNTVGTPCTPDVQFAASGSCCSLLRLPALQCLFARRARCCAGASRQTGTAESIGWDVMQPGLWRRRCGSSYSTRIRSSRAPPQRSCRPAGLRPPGRPAPKPFSSSGLRRKEAAHQAMAPALMAMLPPPCCDDHARISFLAALWRVSHVTSATVVCCIWVDSCTVFSGVLSSIWTNPANILILPLPYSFAYRLLRPAIMQLCSGSITQVRCTSVLVYVNACGPCKGATRGNRRQVTCCSLWRKHLNVLYASVLVVQSSAAHIRYGSVVCWSRVPPMRLTAHFYLHMHAQHSIDAHATRGIPFF